MHIGMQRQRWWGLHYAWIVAAVTFITLLGAAGFRSTPGVLMVPLHQEFGWSTATISIAVAVNLLLYGFSGPFAAALVDKLGLRWVVSGALISVALGAALTTLMRASWQLVALWGGVVGIGTGCMASVLAATVATRWFVRQRGLVMGILTAASATGQLIFLPVLAHLATSAGWRWVSLTIAGGALVVVPLVIVFLRDRPESLGLRAYGATTTETPQARAGNPIAAAFSGLRLGAQSRDFWLLAGSFFVCGASSNGLIGTHFIPASIDQGIPEVTAAGLLALIGVFDIIGTVGSGWLTDRFDPRFLLFMYYALRGLSLHLLPFALVSYHVHSLNLVVFIVFYGLDWVATVPPTVALITRRFGREKTSIVYGWVFSAHQVGAALAALGGGIIRTSMGSYQLAFVSAGVMCLIAAGMVLLVGRGTQRPVRTQVLAGAVSSTA